MEAPGAVSFRVSVEIVYVKVRSAACMRSVGVVPNVCGDIDYVVSSRKVGESRLRLIVYTYPRSLFFLFYIPDCIGGK